MNPHRLKLIHLLGGGCTCGETDESLLDIEHTYGQGYIDREFFKSASRMWKYYLDNFEFESKFLQVRCKKCHIKKSKERNEYAHQTSIKMPVNHLIDLELQALDNNKKLFGMSSDMYEYLKSMIVSLQISYSEAIRMTKIAQEIII